MSSIHRSGEALVANLSLPCAFTESREGTFQEHCDGSYSYGKPWPSSLTTQVNIEDRDEEAFTLRVGSSRRPSVWLQIRNQCYGSDPIATLDPVFSSETTLHITTAFLSVSGHLGRQSVTSRLPSPNDDWVELIEVDGLHELTICSLFILDDPVIQNHRPKIASDAVHDAWASLADGLRHLRLKTCTAQARQYWWDSLEAIVIGKIYDVKYCPGFKNTINRKKRRIWCRVYESLDRTGRGSSYITNCLMVFALGMFSWMHKTYSPDTSKLIFPLITINVPVASATTPSDTERGIYPSSTSIVERLQGVLYVSYSSQESCSTSN